MPKSRMAAEEVPEFVTVADAPGDRVVVVPTLTEAAGPGVPMETVMDEGDPSTETSSVPVVSATVTESVPRTCDEMEMGTAVG